LSPCWAESIKQQITYNGGTLQEIIVIEAISEKVKTFGIKIDQRQTQSDLWNDAD
jgi:hypothetical protein